MTNKVYKVYDDELEMVYGETQIREFALSQVWNCPDDFLEGNINQAEGEDKDRLVKLAEEINSNENFDVKNLTMKEVRLILTERCFDIEELNVY